MFLILLGYRSSYIDIIPNNLESASEKFQNYCQEILTKLSTIFYPIGTVFALSFDVKRWQIKTYDEFGGPALP